VSERTIKNVLANGAAKKECEADATEKDDEGRTEAGHRRGSPRSSLPFSHLAVLWALDESGLPKQEEPALWVKAREIAVHLGSWSLAAGQ
jgi:hypothetical protein